MDLNELSPVFWKVQHSHSRHKKTTSKYNVVHHLGSILEVGACRGGGVAHLCASDPPPSGEGGGALIFLSVSFGCSRNLTIWNGCGISNCRFVWKLILSEFDRRDKSRGLGSDFFLSSGTWPGFIISLWIWEYILSWKETIFFFSSSHLKCKIWGFVVCFVYLKSNLNLTHNLNLELSCPNLFVTFQHLKCCHWIFHWSLPIMSKTHNLQVVFIVIKTSSKKFIHTIWKYNQLMYVKLQ